jgi:hypothetical protein
MANLCWVLAGHLNPPWCRRTLETELRQIRGRSRSPSNLVRLRSGFRRRRADAEETTTHPATTNLNQPVSKSNGRDPKGNEPGTGESKQRGRRSEGLLQAPQCLPTRACGRRRRSRCAGRTYAKRTLLVEKAADGQGGVKSTKTGQARTVRLLAPLADDLAEWRRSLDHADDDALLFSNGSGGIWNDPAWQTWHRDAWMPACRSVRLESARPYDLRHSFVSLLIHEGRSVVDVARQAGHSPTMTLDVHAHVFDEFDVAERVSAEDQIAQARRDVSGLCRSRQRTTRGTARQSRDFPHATGEKAAIEPYNPISLPRISFMISSVPPPIGPRRASRTARSMPYSRM